MDELLQHLRNHGKALSVGIWGIIIPGITFRNSSIQVFVLVTLGVETGGKVVNHRAFLTACMKRTGKVAAWELKTEWPDRPLR